ncbi:MAG: aspartate aminotransferase family protein [Proteobacteria bacterium]|nr:aspartate aminotransferase family protein [Pseudomonadota bacterium]
MTKAPSGTKPGLEITLDPEDWAAFRRFAHDALDRSIDYIEGVRGRPPWQPMPKAAMEALSTPVPQDGKPVEEVFGEFQQNIFPYPLGNIHPRHWGWVNGSGTPEGIVAEMLAATMNSNLTGHDQAPVWVEMQVIGWFRELFDFPSRAGGILVSGGTMANLTALQTARTAKAGFDVRSEGLSSNKAGRYTIYGSTETHYCITKSVDLLGFGKKAYRAIPVCDDFTIDLKALKKQIVADKTAGFTPMVIVGNAGTVNTGAVDPLEELAEIARAHNMWFHVDGAFGAVAYFSDKLRPRLKGLPLADSIAFDLHKWLYQPYGLGCVLVKSAQALSDAFSFEANYFRPLAGGVSNGPMTFNDIGIEHSRRFRALAFWFSMKTQGLEKFKALFEQNVAQAAYLGSLIEGSGSLELLAPVGLNVVAFRYNPGGLSENDLDNLNRLLLIEIQNRGIAVPSATTLDGRFCLRAAIVNHRSRREDFEVLAQALKEIGDELKKKGGWAA